MQTAWASQLNPVVANPQSSARLITGLTLQSGSNVINHGLGRLMQGWILTDLSGAATIYRSAPMNNLTLTLTSSALVTVSLSVF